MSWSLASLANRKLSPGQRAMIACTLEATARKPGNVHPGARFADLCYADFLVGAAAIGPVLDRAGELGVGRTVLECVRETRRLVPTNVNLGIALLLAPLAAVPSGVRLESGVCEVLNRLTLADARTAYEAIRLAAPAGLGHVSEQDVAEEPTEDLLAVMRRAAEGDMVARQYANGFHQVFDAAWGLGESATVQLNWEQAIIFCHLGLMARYPDSLIRRKRGESEADESARRAAAVLAAGWPYEQQSHQLLADLDTWLRAMGHLRNPGTTADLVTASLFVVLAEGRM